MSWRWQTQHNGNILAVVHAGRLCMLVAACTCLSSGVGYELARYGGLLAGKGTKLKWIFGLRIDKHLIHCPLGNRILS
jgi:hypothetical protein